MSQLKMTPAYRAYFDGLEAELTKQYKIAERARSKGFDASIEVESKITHDIAERVEKMLGPSGISQRMHELEHMDRRDIAFKVVEEICLGRFGAMEKERAADQAIRTALAILTEAVTIAPLEGIPKVVIKQNPDKTKFLSVYFAGPIRPAGGTAQALTLVVADVARKTLGLDKWQPNEQVVQRFVEEVRLYERTVRRFQYHITDDDIELAMRSIPVEPTGVSTDPFEVSNYRDVPGIETNRLRGGALIVVVDGVIGRARKLHGNCELLGIQGWDWLKQMGRKKPKILDEKKEGAPTAAFMEEIIVGRPVFSFPGAVGGFRLRYGRARNTGLAANGVHPATMIVLNRFLTTGVQMRTELPGKSTATCPVDSIEPPVVRVKDGSVIRVDTVNLAEHILPNIEKILYLGDYLSNAGDWVQNNKPLLPAGYDENQWLNDLDAAFKRLGNEALEDLTNIPMERIQYFKAAAIHCPTAVEALALTRIDVPLHPRWNYHWTALTREEVLTLRMLLASQWSKGATEIDYDPVIKSLLERILIPHRVSGRKLVLEEDAVVLERILALDRLYVEVKGDTPLDILINFAGFDIRDKAPIFVGARMGRPEKAKERKMSPYVHSLFPVAEAGGPQRDILKADKGIIKVEMVQRQCIRCGNLNYTPICANCSGETKEIRRCNRCGLHFEGERCPNCRGEIVSYASVDLDLKKELEAARKLIGGSLPQRVKCVKRLMNQKRIPEHLAKGIIRARYDLSVFKDGTLRFDLTDIPLTHFKPCEVGTSIDKLRELGYLYDVNGEPLAYSDQMLELMVQDILLPEDCGDYLVKASHFIDDELRDIYKMDPFYNAKTRNDLIGVLMLGLAPHTSAAITSRLIGFITVRNCYAHPYWHAAKRRNCDGDEDGVMLAMDALLNFSLSYLPQQSGGLMDAPLYIIPALQPNEVDKEAQNVDVDWKYSPEFYRLCATGAGTGDFSQVIDLLGARLGTEAQFEGMGYTNEVTDINLGAHHGAYNTLHTMVEKLDSQLELAGKIRAVDQKTVALKILNSHFMKDIIGNLRAFTAQTFRCNKCNQKYRRPPLAGKCKRCGGPIQLTVHKGGIEKYLNTALIMVRKYNLDKYYVDRLLLVKDEIGALFPEELPPEDEGSKQFSLTDFMRTPSKK
jgi:DNA polymerase II large subunit